MRLGRRQPLAPSISSSIALPIVGYRRLATRVIHRALLDLESPSKVDRETARTFLAGSPMLRFWCQLAQLNAGRVVAHMTVEGAACSHNGTDVTGYGIAPIPIASPVMR